MRSNSKTWAMSEMAEDQRQAVRMSSDSGHKFHDFREGTLELDGYPGLPCLDLSQRAGSRSGNCISMTMPGRPGNEIFSKLRKLPAIQVSM